MSLVYQPPISQTLGDIQDRFVSSPTREVPRELKFAIVSPFAASSIRLDRQASLHIQRRDHTLGKEIPQKHANFALR